MTTLAAVVLAHGDPSQLHRLVAALEDVPVFLHVDARTPGPLAGEMVRGLPARVTLLDRRPMSLASWSLVTAELAGLRAALAATSAEHIAVLSGADYPLLSMTGIARELDAWAGRSWLWNRPLPYEPWDTPRNPDGGWWRLRSRFLVRGDQVVFARGIPLRWPAPRDLPPDVEFRASTQWKVYARRDAQALLETVDRRPDLVRFWRTSLVPDETFAASVLSSPALVGADVLTPCSAHPWFLSWPTGMAQHPNWLTTADFDALAAPTRSVTPSDCDDVAAPGGQGTRRLFARKFSSRVDTTVLDRIDAELRR